MSAVPSGALYAMKYPSSCRCFLKKDCITTLPHAAYSRDATAKEHASQLATYGRIAHGRFGYREHRADEATTSWVQPSFLQRSISARDASSNESAHRASFTTSLGSIVGHVFAIGGQRNERHTRTCAATGLGEQQQEADNARDRRGQRTAAFAVVTASSES